MFLLRHHSYMCFKYHISQQKYQNSVVYIYEHVLYYIYNKLCSAKKFYLLNILNKLKTINIL